MPTSSNFKVRVDRSQEEKLLRAYAAPEVARILKRAAQVGAEAGAKVLKDKAPIGVAERLSQAYRKLGLQHGALRGSVRAAAVRTRPGIYVFGPMGRGAVARAFVAHRTRWAERYALPAFLVAREASDAVLLRYMKDH